MPLPELEPMIGKWTGPLPAGRKRLLWCVACTAAFSLLANGYAWFNFYPVHDAFSFVMGDLGYYHVTLGRFLDPVFMFFKGHISVPFLTGLLYTLYLGLCVYIVTDVLKQGSRLGILLTGAFLSVNASTIEMNAVHQYYSDVLLFALLLSLCGVRMLTGGRKRGTVAAFAAFYASFGIYPAYITFAAALLIFRAFTDALFEDRITRETLLGWLRWILVPAAAGIAFLLTGKLILSVRGMDASQHDWSVYTLGSRRATELISRAGYHEREFFKLFFTDWFTGPVSAFSAAFLTALCVAAFCLFCVKKRRKRMLIPFAALLIAFPVGSRLVNIFTSIPDAYRTMFAQFLFFPFLLRLLFFGLDEWRENGRKRLSSVLIALTAALSGLIVAGNILCSNQAFTVQRVLHDRAIYHTGRVLQDLDALYPQRDGTEKVAVIGLFRKSSDGDKYMDHIRKIGVLRPSTGITYEMVLARAAEYLGNPIRYSGSYSEQVRDLDEVRTMPAYPEPGYIATVGEYIVIRLS